MAADPTTETPSTAYPLPRASEAHQQVWRDVARNFDRIEVDKAVMAGEPVIAGTRIPVYLLVAYMSDRSTPEAVAAGFGGDITGDDVREALRYVSAMLQHPCAAP